MNLVLFTIQIFVCFVKFNIFTCTPENTIPKIINIITEAPKDFIEIPDEFLKELFDKNVEKILKDGSLNRFWETFVEPESILITSIFSNFISLIYIEFLDF